MIITASVVTMIIACLLLMFWSNRFVRIVSMYFIIISFNILIGTIYISKTIQTMYMLKMDHQIYQIVNSVKLPLSTIVRAFNFSIALYMMMSVVYAKRLYNIKWYNCLVLTIPCIYIFLYADPELSRRMCIAAETGTEQSAYFWTKFIEINNAINMAMLVIYMIMPVILVLVKLRKTVIFVNRKDTFVSGMCVLIINLYVYFMLFEGMFGNIMFYNVNMVKLPHNTGFSQGFLTALLLWFVVMLVIIIALFFRPYWVHERTNKWIFGLRWKHINRNLSMSLHSYKNAFFGVSQQCRIAENNIKKGEYEKALKRVQLGQSIAKEHIDTISNILDLIGTVNVKYTEVNLYECIKKAIEKSGITSDDKIVISFGCEDKSIAVYGDERHLIESFFNIILNAAEALKIKNEENPHIDIHIIVEEGLVQIDIEDNGTGIGFKNINKIFRPFSSTKTHSRGGVGLNYVSNVIKQHHGEIRVKSVAGKYTLFQVVLPVYTEKVSVWNTMRNWGTS